MVEIEQHLITDLTENATVTKLNNIDPEKINFFLPDIQFDKCIFINERFANFGWGNAVTFLGGNQFILNVYSEIPIKVIRSQGLPQGKAWMIFGQFNLQCLHQHAKVEVYNNIVLCHQTYRIEMPRKCDFSYLQLYSVPEILRHNGQIYHKNGLLHLSIFRSQSVRDRMAAPPVLTIRPEEHQTFVPMLPGQRLQLVTSEKSRLDTTSISSLSIGDTEDKSIFGGGKVKLTNFVCKKVLQRSEPIFLFSKDKKQNGCSVVVIPSINTNRKGEMFPCMVEPVDRAGIVCENMAGFIIMAVSQSPDDWLVDPSIANVHCIERDTIVTFTRKQKYVTLDRINGLWWLTSHHNYSVDKIIT